MVQALIILFIMLQVLNGPALRTLSTTTPLKERGKNFNYKNYCTQLHILCYENFKKIILFHEKILCLQ